MMTGKIVLKPLLGRSIGHMASTLCFLCVLVGIFYLSLTPDYSTKLIAFDGADKYKHAFAYFVLSMNAYLIIPSRYLKITLLGFWIMSGVIELLQSLQPTRTASIYDWLANLIGITGAILVIWLIQVRKHLLRSVEGEKTHIS